jgi:hypothetical protein
MWFRRPVRMWLQRWSLRGGPGRFAELESLVVQTSGGLLPLSHAVMC